MDKAQRFLVLGFLAIAFSLFLHVGSAANTRNRWMPQNADQELPSSPVKLNKWKDHVMLDNGIVKLTLLSPSGLIAEIQYKGEKNVLEYHLKENRRGYWDIVWSTPQERKSFFYELEGTSFKVIAETEDMIEISFMRTWNSSDSYSYPLNVDIRYIMLRGSSGFYSYAIMEHLKGWPDLNIDEARIAFKLDDAKFHYMAISDDIQRIMPTNSDRTGGQVLNYKEAVLLTNPSNPSLKGEVDDKYQYSYDNKDSLVHGWISTELDIGFWVITPSNEFRAGGPVKNDLTSHAGPTSLAVFFSGHYAGPDFGVRLRNGEPWKKVFGPVFIYLNSGSGSSNKPSTLWADAKEKMQKETQKWPYDFPSSEDYPQANQRGTISGRLLVRDRYLNRKFMPAKSAYVGLAPPGDVGSWQTETKGYQFWNQTDENGYFTISGVRESTYNLNAWVQGVMGDYKYETDIVVTPGSQIQLGNLVYNPPRNGPTLWEIGIPDRTPAEFYVPDPSPELRNHLFTEQNQKYRQYGLWDRYTDLYPDQDLVYTVGTSDYRKDWFFAHVNRRTNNTFQSTTWQVSFDLTNVVKTQTYTLRIALASANYAEIQVRINNPYAELPHFTTRLIGRDNAIARHGLHGLYSLYSINVPGFQLVHGKNTIYLKQSRDATPFNGVMYDYIRFEGPP